MSTRKFPYEDDEVLIWVSNHLKFHIAMYIDTLLWLSQIHFNLTDDYRVWNAILENNLVHARALIDFVCKPPDRARARKTDVFAIDYLVGISSDFPLDNVYLKNNSDSIGGMLVHITTKIRADSLSLLGWDIPGISHNLIPALNTFFEIVPEEKLDKGVRDICQAYLDKTLGLDISGPFFPAP
jgi:hypothetical protein